jgi:hopene-associated glycosyltransferase HpnB
MNALTFDRLILISIAGLCLGIWINLLFARGWFWLGHSPRACSRPAKLPRVAVIIPARDEAECMRPIIASLRNQNYAGKAHVFLVDDHSSDGTREEALAVAAQLRYTPITIITARPLPPGWKGKMWALDEGVRAAIQFEPDYFLLADADIVQGADNIDSLVGLAESCNFDLVSYMVKLHCESLAERALIPAFTFFFFMLYPPRWVSESRRRTAAAAGGCVLIRAAALHKIGGIAAIHRELIDDCALAAALKRQGGKAWLGQSASTFSIRAYRGFAGIYRLISRSAFSQLNHSAVLLVGTILAMTLTYLAPPAMVFYGRWVALLGATTWLMMAIAYWPTLRFYNRSPIWAPLLPFVALFYMAATVQSAVDYWCGLGGQWKGRIQDPIPRA